MLKIPVIFQSCAVLWENLKGAQCTEIKCICSLLKTSMIPYSRAHEEKQGARSHGGMLEQSPVSLSTILEKSHWDSTSITAVWCESQVIFGKAVLPIKKSSTPPQSPPNSDFRFYILFCTVSKG